jgi:hypothetical protein
MEKYVHDGSDVVRDWWRDVVRSARIVETNTGRQLWLTPQNTEGDQYITKSITPDKKVTQWSVTGAVTTYLMNGKEHADGVVETKIDDTFLLLEGYSKGMRHGQTNLMIIINDGDPLILVDEEWESGILKTAVRHWVHSDGTEHGSSVIKLEEEYNENGQRHGVVMISNIPGVVSTLSETWEHGLFFERGPVDSVVV